MNSSYFSLLIIVCLWSLISCSTSKDIGEKMDKQALDFSLKIVQYYFAEDCDAVYNSMTDSVLTIDGDGVFAKAPLKERMCKGVKKAIKDKSKNYQDYLTSYQPLVLSPEGLKAKFPKLDFPPYYKPLATDRFFLGFEQKEGISLEKEFIWDDLFFFVLRKQDKQWKIIGVEG